PAVDAIPNVPLPANGMPESRTQADRSRGSGPNPPWAGSSRLLWGRHSPLPRSRPWESLPACGWARLWADRTVRPTPRHRPSSGDSWLIIGESPPVAWSIRLHPHESQRFMDSYATGWDLLGIIRGGWSQRAAARTYPQALIWPRGAKKTGQG